MSVVDLTNTTSPTWAGFDFPDGQPHISVAAGGHTARLVARITSGDDLLRVLLAADALRRGGCPDIHLTVLYLLGARMDRPMEPSRVDGGATMHHHPFTLKVIADLLQAGGFSTITLIDPHSDVATALLNAKVILPVAPVKQAVEALTGRHMGLHPAEAEEALGDLVGAGHEVPVVLVAPDSGASKRVEAIAHELGGLRVAHCTKHRDTATGQLSGFRIVDPETVDGQVCLIVDDICDGGGTFTAVGGLLKDAKALGVGLYVTHGVFSKGMHLQNIDHIFTTTTYQNFPGVLPEHLTILKAYAPS